ncbi:MAG TPA: DUF3147 family protein [Pseudomonadales bacterium]
MIYLVTKFAATALIVVLVSELAKRSTLAGAILASIPTVSVLAMIWIYLETRDTERLASFSVDIVWLVLPSLALFAVLPVLLRLGLGFWWSLTAGIAATAVAYWGSVQLMTWFRA